MPCLLQTVHLHIVLPVESQPGETGGPPLIFKAGMRMRCQVLSWYAQS